VVSKLQSRFVGVFLLVLKNKREKKMTINYYHFTDQGWVSRALPYLYQWKERDILATIEGKRVCGFHKPRILWNPHTLFHRIYQLDPKIKDMKYGTHILYYQGKNKLNEIWTFEKKITS